MEKNKKKLKIWFCRHAQSTRNLRHEMWAKQNQGGKDPELEYTTNKEFLDAKLSSKGIEEAKKLAKFLIKEKIRYILVSPLIRSVQTTQIALQEAHNVYNANNDHSDLKDPNKNPHSVQIVKIIPELIEQAGLVSNMPFCLEETLKMMTDLDTSALNEAGELFFLDYLEEEYREEFKTAFKSEDIEVLYDLIKIYGREVESKASRHKRARKCLVDIKNWVEEVSESQGRELRDGEVMVVGHGNWWRACQMQDVEDYTDYPKTAPNNCEPFLIDVPYKGEDESESESEESD